MKRRNRCMIDGRVCQRLWLWLCLSQRKSPATAVCTSLRLLCHARVAAPMTRVVLRTDAVDHPFLFPPLFPPLPLVQGVACLSHCKGQVGWKQHAAHSQSAAAVLATLLRPKPQGGQPMMGQARGNKSQHLAGSGTDTRSGEWSSFPSEPQQAAIALDRAGHSIHPTHSATAGIRRQEPKYEEKKKRRKEEKKKRRKWVGGSDGVVGGDGWC